MSRTGDEVLVAFDEFLDDNWESVTDADGSADASTLVDSAITEYGTDTLQGGFTRITQPGHAEQYTVKRVRDFDPESGALDAEIPYSTRILTGVAYQFHR